MRKALLIALGAGLLFPAGASACTIPARPAEERVREADVAVWGKVVAAEPTGRGDDNGSPGAEYRYRFRVLETYKGRVRRRITLFAYTDGATCGFGPARVGDRLGLVLDGRRGPWRVNLANLISRKELRSVRRPRRD